MTKLHQHGGHICAKALSRIVVTSKTPIRDIHPLYRDVGCANVDGEPSDFEWSQAEHPMAHCDLKSILAKLYKEASGNNNNLEHAALLFTTFDALGRGGEAKFQTFNDWNFDFYLQIVDTMWRESKRSQS
jgi:hypothetical protein